MTPGDEDTWKLAAALLDKYGLGAFDEAERRAKAALDEEDTMGHGIWLSVAKAVLELTRPADQQDSMNRRGWGVLRGTVLSASGQTATVQSPSLLSACVRAAEAVSSDQLFREVPSADLPIVSERRPAHIQVARHRTELDYELAHCRA